MAIPRVYSTNMTIQGIVRLKEKDKDVYYLNAMKRIVDNIYLTSRRRRISRTTMTMHTNPRYHPMRHLTFWIAVPDSRVPNHPPDIYAIQDTEREFIEKLSDLKAKYLDTKALWNTVVKKRRLPYSCERTIKTNHPSLPRSIQVLRKPQGFSRHRANSFSIIFLSGQQIFFRGMRITVLSIKYKLVIVGKRNERIL